MEAIISLDPALASVMDASNDAMLIVDALTGNFVAMNEAQFRLCGFNLQQLNDTALGKFYNLASTKLTLRQLSEAARYEIFLCDIQDNQGKNIAIELNATKLQLNGKTHLLLVNKQKTSQQHTHSPSSILSIEQAFKDTEAKWQSITENSPDQIMLINLEGEILFVNRPCCGFLVEQTVGQSCFELYGPEHSTALKACVQKIIQTSKPQQIEINYTPDDGGETIYLDSRFSPIVRDDKIIAICIFSRDISILRHTLQQLEQSQRQLHLSLHAGRIGTWEWDINTNVVTWSEGMEAMFGMDPGSFGGSYDAFRKIVHPDDFHLIEAAINDTMLNNKPYNVDYRAIFKDGSLHWYTGQGEVIFNEHNQAIRLIGTVTDITQRKLIEETLSHQKYLLDKSQEIAHIGSYSWNIVENTFTWSEEMFRIFGVSKQEFTGDGAAIIDKVIHPDDREKLISSQLKILKERKPYPLEYRVVWKDGTIRYVWGEGDIIFDASGDVIEMVGTVQDITERKLAEAQLKETQQKLILHFKLSLLGIIELNTKCEITEWNPAAEKIFGYTRDEALGHSAIQLIVPASANAKVDQIWQALLANAGGKNNTNENITKDGKIITCEWYNTPLINELGEVVGVISMVHDITDRILAQRELDNHRLHLEELVMQRTEQIHKQAKIIDQVRDSIVTTDLNGLITSWNNGATRLYGYTREEVMGRHISLLHSKDQQELIFQQVTEPLKQRGENEVDIQVICKSGEMLYIRLSLSLQYNENGEAIGVIGYATDISARKLAEQQLIAQQKALENANRELESFSYTVSHDLRAPLRSIEGFSTILYDEYYDKLDTTAKSHLDRIRRNTNKMASLIDDLLQLSRITRHTLHKEMFDIGSLAMDVVQKYKYENANRKIEFNVDSDMRVEGDANLIRIALDNLIDNACKYTGTRDVAKISFTKIDNNTPTVFCIKDNGVGFDMRYIDKLFGPFQRLHSPEEFTGNGIGLATVARIIKRHGGKIWAESEINQGAKFCFTLHDSGHGQG